VPRHELPLFPDYEDNFYISLVGRRYQAISAVAGICMIATARRKEYSVVFERGFDTHLMAIDGTWRRACIMTAASESGAKLTLLKSVEGLNLAEFFLLLSTTGLAYRRCELAWINGDQMGVNFLFPGKKKRPPEVSKDGELRDQ
jgi:hypothetical protein